MHRCICGVMESDHGPLVIFLINNSMYNEKMYFILFFYDDNQWEYDGSSISNDK